MQPMNFPESNGALSAPAGIGCDKVEPLFVWRGECGGSPQVISKWKLTPEELAEINRTGEVWLHVLGRSMPPVAVVVRSPFAAAEEVR